MTGKIREAVLRVPCDRLGVRDVKQFQREHEDLFAGEDRCPGFRIFSAGRKFIDYVMERGPAEEDCGEYARPLTEEESREYGPLFARLLPDMNMKDVRHAEYVRDEGAEAPYCYMPFVFRRLTIFDVISVMEDPDVRQTMGKIAEDLGETGRFLVRWSGIGPENKVFIEAEREELCEKALDDFLLCLKEKEYIR